MQVLIVAMALSLLNSQTDLDSFSIESKMPTIAINHCSRTKNASFEKKKELTKVAKIIYGVEKELNIPYEMRGMTLAAACLESGFNPSALGDRKFSKKGKPKAVGVFQMWKWYENAYGTDRKDPRSSAIGWLTHIKKMVPKVKKQCRYKSVRRLWTAAWVTGIRYKKPGGRCLERPKHYKFFLKIRKVYETQTRNSSTKLGKTL